MQTLLQETNCTPIPNRFIINTGLPFVELVKTAEEEKVVMVVMGNKGAAILPVQCSVHRLKRCFNIARCRCLVFVQKMIEMKEENRNKAGYNYSD